MVILYLAIAMFCEYFLGSLSFARIFTWWIAHKDITQEGSKNPGTMNILRTRGFGEALLTLSFDAMKIGVPALGMFFLFNHFFPGYGDLAYFLVAVIGIFAHCFPIYYKFKGGKGIASMFGMFVFHPNFWWISLICFAICFVIFIFLHYGFVVNFLFLFTLSSYVTYFYATTQPSQFIAIIVIIWLIALLIVVMHRKNIVRLVRGEENKVNLLEKIFKKKPKQEQVETKEENKEDTKDKSENEKE